MYKLIEVKQRMKTVMTIGAIAKTMSTVSAAKLSSTKRRAEGMRLYSEKTQDILFRQLNYVRNLGIDLSTVSPLLLKKKVSRNILVLLITSDRGMCGNYNIAVTREALNFRFKRERQGQNVFFVAKGIKGSQYLKKRNANLIHIEKWTRAGVLSHEIERFLSYFLDIYFSGKADEIYVAYTKFFSPVQRKPVVTKLIPLETDIPVKERVEEIEKWFYEPSLYETIRELIPAYLRIRLYDMFLESFSSEHGARMISMEEARERAEQALKECRVMYNRLRREVVTIDLLGILFAFEVVKETAESSTEAVI